MVSYEEWCRSVPGAITGDPLWHVTAYKKALYAADIGWEGITRLSKDRRTWDLTGQLCQSLGSMSANIAEGYSRGTGRDRARFYEYALGSARESRDWYYKARHVLGPEVTQHRISLAAEVIRLLLTMTRDQRGDTLREEPGIYHVGDAQDPDDA